MTLEEQIQEVSIDIDEIKRVIDYTTRPRIKQNLELQQRKFEKELSQLQEKLQKQQQAAAEAAERAARASTIPTATQSYTKDISVYAWDQTDKFVKIYVQNLDGIGSLPENQVQCSFEKRGFHLQIQNLKNINYFLKILGLLHDIEPGQSTFKVRQKGYDHCVFTKSRIEKLGMLAKGREENTYQTTSKT
ncbi:unnamed protein product [Rotaria sordida]|uniref:CS domain-containing protein n=1 Tax=Rotaria sordida TaxID=392033 RepID=A0A816DDF2_9BILA|nr:unnamed protein product [Rotaria sordida]CAF1294114.1 unnamed protein product [Rotaria sordida]CAF1430973.1 unnamed protein product [Rotaria sordida]CAF1632677.1 unnamed protein product [Rotaria sordida]